MRDGTTFFPFRPADSCAAWQLPHWFAQSGDACVKQKFARGAATLFAARSHPHPATLARRLNVVPIRPTAHRATKPGAMQSQ
ncbi:hypothetical protein WI26_23340 [Burkholderia diffusa]|nr:hypothetical protein WI26_23340 [Burkholderia diffusa]